MLNRKLMCLVLGVTGQIISVSAWTANPRSGSLSHSAGKSDPVLFEPVNQALERFSNDSKAFMNEAPAKFLRAPSATGKTRFFTKKHPTPVSYFTSVEYTSPENVVSEKLASRCKCQKGFESFLRGTHPKSGWDVNNRPEFFLTDPEMVIHLDQMEQLGYRASYLEETPWSGDYFAMARGILGNRAFDPGFAQLDDWKDRFDYIQDHPFAKIFARGKSKEINKLSVSEKYDILLGDLQGRLTNSLWEQGRQYFEATGEVEEWMGICHGWAPASYMVPRPLSSIEVPSFDGQKKIKLNPAELKGLISQQWAQNPVNSRFVGQRCDSKNPQQDENGRVIESGCLDINPATWHIIVVNKIAKNRKSFVFDATYDYEVWNQPVYGYKYTYFNPSTNKEEASLEKATVRRESFDNDKFAKYRATDTQNIVGIAMEVSYSVETTINDSDTDSPDSDFVTSVRYLYDLELNDKGQIIGGEWYTNKHPDFLWTPEEGESARSPIDLQINIVKWLPDQPTPLLWRKGAEYLAPQSMILGPLVDSLLAQSRTGPNW